MGVTIPRQKGHQILSEPSKVVLTFNPSIWKTEADKSESEVSLYNEFQASQGYSE